MPISDADFRAHVASLETWAETCAKDPDAGDPDDEDMGFDYAYDRHAELEDLIRTARENAPIPPVREYTVTINSATGPERFTTWAASPGAAVTAVSNACPFAPLDLITAKEA